MGEVMKKILPVLLCLLILCAARPTVLAAQPDITKPVDVARITFTTENGNGTKLQKADGYVNAEVVIKDTDGSSLSDSVVMKVRGNSTAFTNVNKKSYTFKFPKKKNVLNLGSGKKWALVANAFDPTLARNYTAFSLAQRLGIQYTSNFKVVEVVVDGSFRGCYMLFEPVDDGKDRVDIDVDSGDFMLEIETYREEDDVTYFKSNGIRFAVSEPDPPSEEQTARIKSAMDNYLSVLNRGTEDEIREKIDVDSFVSFYVLNEFLKTLDFDTSSVFYYQKDNKLYAGPPWDYDLSTGNVNEGFSQNAASSYKTDGIYISSKNLYKYLCQKPWFSELIKAKFTEIYPYIENIGKDGGFIDTFLSDYNPVIKRNFTDAGWDVTRYYVNVMKVPLATFEQNYAFYKNWCYERAEWLREHFGIEKPTEPVTTEPATVYVTPSATFTFEKEVFVTDTFKINFTSDNKVKFTTNKKTVARVNSKGVVRGVKAGKAIITASVGKFKVRYIVTVKNPILNAAKKVLKRGKSFNLKVTGVIGNVRFTSAKKNIATVSSNGKVTAKKKGTAVIKVTANGVTLKCKIIVR